MQCIASWLGAALLAGLVAGDAHAPSGRVRRAASGTFLQGSAAQHARDAPSGLPPDVAALMAAMDKWKKDRASLAGRKGEYDAKLEKERQVNARLRVETEKMAERVDQVKIRTRKLKTSAVGLEGDNDRLRHVLRTVGEKVSGVGQYVNASLGAADDRHASYLAVLRRPPATPSHALATAQKKKKMVAQDAADASDGGDQEEPSLEDEDDDSGNMDGYDYDADDHDGVVAEASEGSDVLLAVHNKHSHRGTARAHGPGDAGVSGAKQSDIGSLILAAASDSDNTTLEDHAAADDEQDSVTSESDGGAGDSDDLVGSVSSGLHQLAAQDSVIDSKLEANFETSLHKLKQERGQIVAEQKALSKTLSAEDSLEKEWEAAVTGLSGTKSKLEKQLSGLRRYLRKLSDFVLEPTAEAEDNLPSLPSSVSVFLETETPHP